MLAIKVQMIGWIGQYLGPGIHIVADQVAHLDPRRGQPGVAQPQIART